MKSLKEIIRIKGYAIGSWINTASTIVTEIMSAAGFDFLTIDIEHSSIDIERTSQLFQAMKSGNRDCIPLVRLHGNTYAENKRYLDAGAMGVIAPLIKTGEEADVLVKSVKYPPEGERGVGYCRANGYGFSFNSYINSSNRNTFICVQIEHIDSVKNIDKIFSVEGIDAAFIGPYDLSASMGITGDFNNTDYREVIKIITRKCDSFNLIPGIHVVQPNPDEVKQRIDEGFKLIAYSLDITMLGLQCRQGIEKINSLIN